MKTAVHIEVVTNGFVVSDVPRFEDRGYSTYPEGRHVFETFENLAKWLHDNLEDPTKQRGRKMTETEAIKMAADQQAAVNRSRL